MQTYVHSSLMGPDPIMYIFDLTIKEKGSIAMQNCTLTDRQTDRHINTQMILTEQHADIFCTYSNKTFI